MNDRIISERPYVKLLGPISYSEHHKCHTALAQVNDSLCVIEVKMTEQDAVARQQETR